jgi:hypothetical protein
MAIQVYFMVIVVRLWLKLYTTTPDVKLINGEKVRIAVSDINAIKKKVHKNSSSILKKN